MENLLAAALSDHRSNRLDSAEAAYRSLLRAEPDHADAHHLLGVVLCQLGRADEALRSVDRAIERRPDLAAYRAARGEILRELGRLDEAAVALVEALELDPTLATAHNNLGLIRLRAGRAEAAVASFDEALRLRPGLTIALFNRAEALQKLERWEKAAATYRRVLESDPDNPWAHAYLGHVLFEWGDVDRLDEAEAHCRRAVELAPDSYQVQTNLGNIHAAKGDFETAIASFRKAIALEPAQALPWNNIGRAEQQLGRLDAAAEAYEKALALEPQSVRARTNHADLLAERGRELEAITHYRIALENDPLYAQAHNGLGGAFRSLERRDEARAAYEEAIRVRPGFPPPRLNLSRLFAENGDFDRSNEQVRAIIERYPRAPDAYFLLASNLRGKLPDTDLEAMIGLLDHEHFDDAARAAVAFGIAHALDGRKRYDEAARYLEIGNACQAAALARRGDVRDPRHNAEILAGIIAEFDADFFRAVHGRGSPSRLPIFIVGMPRSGTTLTEQILASHSRVVGAGELPDIQRLIGRLAAPSATPAGVVYSLLGMEPAPFHDLAQHHIDRLAALGKNAEHVVDKMPSNYLHLGLIAALWPEAQIIVCRRDPRDIAMSCWSNYFGAINWANDFGAIAEQIIEHDRLMAHWKAVLPRPPIEVAYEELVADFEPQTRRLIEALGLSWDPACLDFHTLKRPIRTASLSQVRKPLYSQSSGRWRNYQATLIPFLEALERLGHPLTDPPPASVGD